MSILALFSSAPIKVRNPNKSHWLAWKGITFVTLLKNLCTVCVNSNNDGSRLQKRRNYLSGGFIVCGCIRRVYEYQITYPSTCIALSNRKHVVICLVTVNPTWTVFAVRHSPHIARCTYEGSIREGRSWQYPISMFTPTRLILMGASALTYPVYVWGGKHWVALRITCVKLEQAGGFSTFWGNLIFVVKRYGLAFLQCCVYVMSLINYLIWSFSYELVNMHITCFCMASLFAGVVSIVQRCDRAP